MYVILYWAVANVLVGVVTLLLDCGGRRALAPASPPNLCTQWATGRTGSNNRSITVNHGNVYTFANVTNCYGPRCGNRALHPFASNVKSDGGKNVCRVVALIYTSHNLTGRKVRQVFCDLRSLHCPYVLPVHILSSALLTPYVTQTKVEVPRRPTLKISVFRNNHIFIGTK